MFTDTATKGLLATLATPPHPAQHAGLRREAVVTLSQERAELKKKWVYLSNEQCLKVKSLFTAHT